MYNLGIDLGGTVIKTGIVDDDFNIIGRGSLPTGMPRPTDELMDEIAAACALAAKDAGIELSDIDHAGIGTPGTAIPTTGVLEFSGNLDAHNYPMGKALSERLGTEIFVENDANAAAFGEAIAGAAKGCRDAVCITLGTGVGGGFIINGRIFSGSNFAGTEIGHTVIVYDGLQCNCGRKGCWEKYASATALISQTKAAMEAHPDSKMWEIAGSLDNVDGKTAYDGMRAGDSAAIEVVDTYHKYIACGIVNVINIFQPEIVCIGGGVSKEGSNIIDPVMDIVVKERFSRYSKKQSKLVTAQLGNDAGIIGAANLWRGEII